MLGLSLYNYIEAIRIDPDYAYAYINRGIVKEEQELFYCSDYKSACDLGDEDGCKWYNEQCK